MSNLRDSIHQHRVDVERANAPVIELSASNILAEQLSGTPEQILYALSVFEMANDRASSSGGAPPLETRIGRRPPACPATPGARRQYGGRHEWSVCSTTSIWKSGPRRCSTWRSTRTSIRSSGSKARGVSDFSIRAAMVAFLARPGPAQKLDAAQAILNAMAAETGEGGQRVRLEAARLIAILPEIFDRELRAAARSDAEVAGAAFGPW